MKQIRHVILLMLENRSFDQMLGACQQVIPNLDGVDPNARPRVNTDIAGKPYEQLERPSWRIDPDPKHATHNVLIQILNNNSNFVFDYDLAYDKLTVPRKRNVMRYYGLGKLHALHTLAQEFAVCDRWFSSVPGPTWTNRLFALSGTSLGRVRMPETRDIFDLDRHDYDQDTIFDRLDQKGKSWKVYYHDFPLSLLFTHQRRLRNLTKHRPFSRFLSDAKRSESDFPNFAFIEPDYLGGDANDDHPPHDARNGQRLIARIYNAIRANAELWRSSLLIITYDEHGGFYDHVPPPKAVAPDAHREEYTFDRLGVRVPTVLVSPWIQQQVVRTEFDHTSLLRFMIDRWKLRRKLGNRVAKAKSIATAIGTTFRENTPTRIPLARSVRPTRIEEPSDNQRALLTLGESLEHELKKGAAETLEQTRKALQTLAERSYQQRREAAINLFRTLSTEGNQ